MDEMKQEKIRKFLNDPIMSGMVKEVLRESFLKPRMIDKSMDLHVLAASRIAIDLLEEGWRDLLKMRVETTTERPKIGHV